MIRGAVMAGCCVLICAASAMAHDTWVQTNTNVIRAGDAVHIDLMLGNHGNDHRDFKLASKIGLEGVQLSAISPSGKKYDLKGDLADLGYAPKEGFWSTKFATADPGLYTVAHSADTILTYGKPTRSLRSAKAMFVASKSLDRVPQENPGFDAVLGHPLELVPVHNPVTPMGPGQPLKVRLLLKGKPLADTRVSFIPRGETLREEFDDRYERQTNADGEATFTPKTGNYYLIVAHHVSPESGEGYEATKYAATLCVFVPEICPCCGE